MRKYQYIPVEDILKNDSLRPVYNFVAEKHAGQLREGTEKIPHLNHLLRVFEISMNSLVDAPLKPYLYSKMSQWVIKIASVALLHVDQRATVKIVKIAVVQPRFLFSEIT